MNIGSASRIHGRRPVVGEWADDAAHAYARPLYAIKEADRD